MRNKGAPAGFQETNLAIFEENVTDYNNYFIYFPNRSFKGMKMAVSFLPGKIKNRAASFLTGVSDPDPGCGFERYPEANG